MKNIEERRSLPHVLIGKEPFQNVLFIPGLVRHICKAPIFKSLSSPSGVLETSPPLGGVLETPPPLGGVLSPGRG